MRQKKGVQNKKIVLIFYRKKTNEAARNAAQQKEPHRN